MFNAVLTTAVADATGTASAAHIALVANFLTLATSTLGFGIDTVASGGAPTEVDSKITAWTATFNVNGKAANVVFSAAAATFPAGATVRYGATRVDGPDGGTTVGDSDTDPWSENATSPAATLWTAVVTVDGDDVGSTLQGNERVLTLTQVIK